MTKWEENFWIKFYADQANLIKEEETIKKLDKIITILVVIVIIAFIGIKLI